MTTEQLKEYLGIVVDMEKAVFLQDQTINELRSEIGTLCQPGKFFAPLKPSIPTPKQTGKSSLVPVYILLIIGGVMLPLTGGVILSFAFLVGLVAIPVCSIRRKKEEAEYHREMEKYNEEISQYNIEMEKYQRNISNDQARIEQESQRKEVLHADLVKLQTHLAVSRETLSKIYDKNIIFPKYRNLVMVCSLYEYICAGRCTTLEGHEGAYNILEMEIRLDRIITQINKVVAQLNAIQSNQFMLYSVVQESNQKSTLLLESTNRMADQLQSLGNCIDTQSAQFQVQLSNLQNSSALTAYHTERAQKELAYMNRMDYLTGRNDGVFFNQPPV